MNVFKMAPFYRYANLTLLIVWSLCTLLRLMLEKQITGNMTAELLVVTSAVVLAVIINIYSWTLSVTISGGSLVKRTLFIKKTISLADVEEITPLTLRGRFLFIMVTPTSFVFISTLMERFDGLMSLVQANVPEKAFEGVHKITVDEIRGKGNITKLMQIILLVCGLFYLSSFVWK